MKLLFLSIGLTLATALFAFGQAADVKTIKQGSVEEELVRLKRSIGRAYVEKDLAALERLYADEYTVTDDAGETTTKAQELERMKNGSSVYEFTSYEDVKVRVYGETAIVAGRGTVKGRGRSGAFHSQYRSTNVFVKRGGRWQAVAAHISGVKAL